MTSIKISQQEYIIVYFTFIGLDFIKTKSILLHNRNFQHWCWTCLKMGCESLNILGLSHTVILALKPHVHSSWLGGSCHLDFLLYNCVHSLPDLPTCTKVGRPSSHLAQPESCAANSYTTVLLRCSFECFFHDKLPMQTSPLFGTKLS